MPNNPASQIAALITEDPDILIEFDQQMDQPMDEVPPPTDTAVDNVDIEKQAKEIAGESDRDVQKDIRDQEQRNAQRDLERRKVLEPQIRELEGSVRDVGRDITQGQAALASGQDRFNSLDSDMDTITSLLQALEQNAY